MKTTIVDNACAFLSDIVESGQFELVQLYQPDLWRRGELVLETFADAPNDFPEHIAYMCMLRAVLDTPTLATPEAERLYRALMNEDVLAFLEGMHARLCELINERADAALDTKVRPMLAWLDAPPAPTRPRSKWQAFRQRRAR